MTHTVTLDRAQTPRGLRLYAIGDVHGDADSLAATLDRVDADLRRRPATDWRIILHGDYIDRGPESRAVLTMLAGLDPRLRAYCLRGNHEQCLLDILADPEAPCLYPWLMDGGLATLASYGIDATLDDIDDCVARSLVRGELAAAITVEEAGFLAGLPHAVRFGDFFFTHAGVRPGVPLSAQRPGDLMFIREPFLTATGAHEAVIIHGHGLRATVEAHNNRIALNTISVDGPACLILEDRAAHVLDGAGLRPLEQPRTLVEIAAAA